MNYEVAMTTGVSGNASAHLLHQYQKGGLQEEFVLRAVASVYWP